MSHLHRDFSKLRIWMYACWRLLLLLCVLTAQSSQAHGIKAAYLEIEESSPGVASALWKLPLVDTQLLPTVAGCTVEEQVEQKEHSHAGRFIHRLRVNCPGPLAGREIRFEGLSLLVSDVVIRVVQSDGSVASQVSNPRRDGWTIPARQSWAEAAARYVHLGIEHILSGTDHLLFVLGLLLLIGFDQPRRLLWAVSSFTLAHSLTLGATALEVIRLNTGAAEACIALSLVLLALDIGREGAGKYHASWLVFPFGLVHGLGFASALGEVGLPQDAVLPALLGFNVGVEMGQLAFIASCALVFRVLQQSTAGLKVAARLPQVGAYAIGWAGMFWLIQRWSNLLHS